jgi:hypothetical protein
MKTLALALTAAAAAIVTGCVAYPVDSYHHRGDGGAYREDGRYTDRDEHRDERRDRDRDRDNERGDRRQWQDRP